MECRSAFKADFFILICQEPPWSSAKGMNRQKMGIARAFCEFDDVYGYENDVCRAYYEQTARLAKTKPATAAPRRCVGEQSSRLQAVVHLS